MRIDRRKFLGTLLTLPAAAQNYLATGPWLQFPKRGSAVIRWRGAPTVLWARDGEVWQEIPGHPVGTLLEIERHDLKEDATYHYQVNGSSYSFQTGVAGVTRFLVIGDTGTGSAAQSALASRMAAEPAHFLLHTGDVAYPDGRAENYERNYLDFYHAMMPRVPFYPCPGNHDYYETEAGPYIGLHRLPVEGVPSEERGRYYAFETGDATIVSLDSNAPMADPARRARMLTWLDGVLARSAKFWRIVYFHHPPYAAGPNEGDPLSHLARALLPPILERHGVSAVFNGHEHSYQRSVPVGPRQTVYFTTGGGGADLYPAGHSPLVAKGISAHHYLRAGIDGYRMRVEAVATEGESLDRAELAPRPMLRPAGVTNAASFETRIGRGAPISLFGLHLAKDDRATVSANGRELPLLAATPVQTNAMLPPDLVGSVRIELTTPNGTVRADVEVAPFAPALFAGSALRNGDDVEVFATGLLGWNEPVAIRLGGLDLTGAVEPGPVEGVQRIRFRTSLSGVLHVRAGTLLSNTIRL